MGPRYNLESSPISILLVDDSEPFSRALSKGLAEQGVDVQTTGCFRSTAAILAANRPTYLVCELRVAGRSLRDHFAEISGLIGAEKMVIATAYPAIGTAVRFTRLGVAAYLPKPVSASELLHALGSREESPAAADDHDDSTWPTLDRTIWEYVSQVCASTRSLSEAARRLGLHKRSLRRMLAKYPPPR